MPPRTGMLYVSKLYITANISYLKLYKLLLVPKQLPLPFKVEPSNNLHNYPMSKSQNYMNIF